MSDGTAIEWTDATWNVITGCSVVSPGCTNCYAMKLAGSERAIAHHPSRVGLTRKTKAGPVWTGEVRFNEQWLTQPLHWRKPRKVFVCAHGDLFHEKVKIEWLDKIWAVMALARHHTFQVLTKRPDLARAYLTDVDFSMRVGALLEDMKPSQRWNGNEHEALIALGKGILPNVWLGTSVEDQQRANERIPVLLDTPAVVHWLSMEPLIGPVDLQSLSTMRFRGAERLKALTGTLEGMFGDYCSQRLPGVDWVVLGGESGDGARPMHPDWVVAIHDQCEAAEVPFLFKQWGEFLPDQIGPEDARSIRHPPGQVNFNKVGKKKAGRKLFGVEHDGYPNV